MNKVREKLIVLAYEQDLVELIRCSEEEEAEYRQMYFDNQALPDNVFRRDDHFLKCLDKDISMEEINTFLKFRRANDMHTIRNCVLYFTIINIISIVGAIIFLFFIHAN